MNDQLTGKIIGAAYDVHNHLGFGFLESVYEKALSIELANIGIAHEVQLVNYLNATKIDIGLLIIFGPRHVELKRKYRVAKPDKVRPDGQVDRSVV